MLLARKVQVYDGNAANCTSLLCRQTSSPCLVTYGVHRSSRDASVECRDSMEPFRFQRKVEKAKADAHAVREGTSTRSCMPSTSIDGGAEWHAVISKVKVCRLARPSYVCQYRKSQSHCIPRPLLASTTPLLLDTIAKCLSRTSSSPRSISTCRG